MPRTIPNLNRLLWVGLGVTVLALGAILLLGPGEDVRSSLSVTAAPVQPSGDGAWKAPRHTVALESAGGESFVVRLRGLRTQRVPVTVVGESGDQVLFESRALAPDDLLVVQPAAVQAGHAVAFIGGVDDARLIRLTLDAWLMAAAAGDLEESVRFVAIDYSDQWGYDYGLLSRLLKRVYGEFEDLRVGITAPPIIHIEGERATVQADVLVSGIYRGRRNFLLGDDKSANTLLLWMRKSSAGWKVVRIAGMRPLGFEEEFVRLLGAEVGLPLTEDEQRQKQDSCMPCRQRMADRFGPSK